MNVNERQTLSEGKEKMADVTIPDGLYDFARALGSRGIGVNTGEIAGAVCAIWPDNVTPDSLWLESVYMAKIPVVHSPLTTVPEKFIAYEIGVCTTDVSSFARQLSRLLVPFHAQDYSQCRPGKLETPKGIVTDTVQPVVQEEDTHEHISICMAVKDRAWFIDGLCDNLVAQDYDLKNIELCVADCGSHDNIQEVLQRHANKFAQVKYCASDRRDLAPEADINAMVANMASFEKIIIMEPEVRFGHIGTLRRISSSLDKKDVVYHVQCQKLAEGVEWRPNPTYSAHEVYGAPIVNDGFFCVGINKARFVDHGGIDERFVNGAKGASTYFHYWHQTTGEWQSSPIEYACYHLYHKGTDKPERKRGTASMPLLTELRYEHLRPNMHIEGNLWQHKEILSDLNIWRDGDKPAVTVVVPYMHSPGRHKLLKIMLTELRKYQTVRNIEIIVSEIGVANKANKLRMPDKNVFTRTTKWVKGEAVNVGVLEAKSDLILMLDADIVARDDFIDRICTEIARGYTSAQLGGKLYKLSQQALEELVIYNKKMKKSWYEAFALSGTIDRIGDTISTDYGRTYVKYPGGAFAIKRDVYVKLGGISERYTGWGQEDQSFQDIMDFGSPRHLRRSDVPLIHLHHPMSTDVGVKNEQYYKEEREATLPKVIKNNSALFKSKYLTKKA